MSYAEGQMLYRADVVGTYVNYATWKVIKVTPKGGWIKRYWDGSSFCSTYSDYDQRKWIPHNARFASTTKEEALARLKARTRSYVKHCRRRLAVAEERAEVLNMDCPRELPLLGRVEPL